MLTGVELGGIILSVFPLVISGLEHYENGFQQIKDWIRFRANFTKFMNALCRQRIFFRQNIEELLAPIVASEYEMSQLLDNPGGRAWADPELNEKLIKRLSGAYEYECYTATAGSILELLEKLKIKLKIVDGQVRYRSLVIRTYAKRFCQASLDRNRFKWRKDKVGVRVQAHQLHLRPKKARQAHERTREA